MGGCHGRPAGDGACCGWNMADKVHKQWMDMQWMGDLRRSGAEMRGGSSQYFLPAALPGPGDPLRPCPHQAPHKRRVLLCLHTHTPQLRWPLPQLPGAEGLPACTVILALAGLVLNSDLLIRHRHAPANFGCHECNQPLSRSSAADHRGQQGLACLCVEEEKGPPEGSVATYDGRPVEQGEELSSPA